MDNIILIGMPGAGKSTVGVVLAKNLGYSFLDSDLLIQEKEHMILHDIIEKYGLEGFNQIENEVNSSIQAKKTVIATGGSVIYGKEAMMHLKSIGTVIYLKLPYQELKCRLGDLNQRGVSIRQGQTLAELYNERIPLYEKYADITIDCQNYSIRETVKQIADSVRGDLSTNL
ncbi:MAG: shikimate kinase [Lachnospiraceae bacterium]|nr:shikimate kinase [Lachnospiraceae bacterium]